eukprot:CAMPEP_0114677042 /NCGR_PEP_ID=MMETSP0191-20121206/50030_1 /TAXON_ID=126664 /ORGANISM="Sorites sp." /LENGTH=222 /DNA_ID=CAMNT_0001949025 /DNA_START=355 /DNA_END=1020 /DNA_ORIENTATION=+
MKVNVNNDELKENLLSVNDNNPVVLNIQINNQIQGNDNNSRWISLGVSDSPAHSSSNNEFSRSVLNIDSTTNELSNNSRDKPALPNDDITPPLHALKPKVKDGLAKNTLLNILNDEEKAFIDVTPQLKPQNDNVFDSPTVIDEDASYGVDYSDIKSSSIIDEKQSSIHGNVLPNNNNIIAKRYPLFGYGNTFPNYLMYSVNKNGNKTLKEEFISKGFGDDEW